MKKDENGKSIKTFKREVALIQLSLHWALVLFVCITVYRGQDTAALVPLVTGLSVWVYGFLATAFGMDAWAKQVRKD
jgi:hypothetical protein